MKRIKIDGIETGYLISEDGRVYSELSRKYLKESSTRGYNTVSLRLNGKTHSKYIHKLVAEHFHEKIDGYEVNHIDGNKTNNHFSNLEWISKSDNIKHAYSLGLAKVSNEQIKRPILKLDANTGEVIKEYETIQEAAEELGNKNKSANIIRACQGKQKTSYGYRWKYKDGKAWCKWNEI